MVLGFAVHFIFVSLLSGLLDAQLPPATAMPALFGLGVGMTLLVAFGAALPALRRALRKSLSTPGFPKEKVVAMVVAVMGATMIRIGNVEYAAGNRSYGLTTLRNRHVQAVRGGHLRFEFRGKSGKQHEVLLTDARLTRLVRRCQQLPGQPLFQYLDEEGHCQPIGSADVNDWLRATMGSDFSAKDFRTWGATEMAFRALASTSLPTKKDGTPGPERAIAAAEASIVQQIAEVLSFARSAWGNDAAAVDAKAVAKLREHTDPASSSPIILQMR